MRETSFSSSCLDGVLLILLLLCEIDIRNRLRKARSSKEEDVRK